MLDRRRRDPRRRLRERRARACSSAAASRDGGDASRALSRSTTSSLRSGATGRMVDFETWIDGEFVNTHARRRPDRRDADRLDRLRAVVRRPDRASRASTRWCWCRSARTRSRTGRSSCRRLASSRSARSTVADTRARSICDGVALGELAPGDGCEIARAARHDHAPPSARLRLLPHAALQAALGPRRACSSER